MPLGWQELTIILVIVIIIFGAGKLPEIGGALGKGIKEFKNESAFDEKGNKIEAGTSTTMSAVTAPEGEKVMAEKREVRADEI